MLRARAGGGVPHPVTTAFTLYRDLPCVDIELTLHDKPADPWPEAGWICLPLNVEQPQFRLGRQGSIIDPARGHRPGRQPAHPGRQQRPDGHRCRGTRRGPLPAGQSAGQPRLARLLEVLEGFRAATKPRVRQPVQQPVDDEFPFVERRHLDRARAAVGGGGRRRWPRRWWFRPPKPARRSRPDSPRGQAGNWPRCSADWRCPRPARW